MKGIYNYELKEKFLATQKSRKSYETVFRKTYRFEVDIEKDIYNFSFDELETVLYGFKLDNFSTIETYKGDISTYLNWCRKKGYISKNELTQIQRGNYSKYLSQRIKYLTKVELEDWQSNQKDIKDILISQLLFLGVETLELQNLRPVDFDEDKKQLCLMKYPRSGSSKIINADEKIAGIIKKVIEESECSLTDFFILKEDLNNVGKVVPLKKNFIRDSGAIHYAHTLGMGKKEIGKKERLVIAGKFTEIASPYLMELITMENIQYTYDEEKLLNEIPYQNEPSSLGDLEKSASLKDKRIYTSTIARYVRDTPLARKLKKLYENKCMVCETIVQTANGAYSEAHHIQPYNESDRGDDVLENMIVLCPNCHVSFDSSFYAINPSNNQINCLDEQARYHGLEIKTHPEHKLGEEYLKYAWNLLIRFKQV